MVRTSIASYPVFVLDEPHGREEAKKNYYSFCKEKSDLRREQGISKEGQSKLMGRISSLPRMMECYGWLKLHSKTWENLPSSLGAPYARFHRLRRYMEADTEYTALVYEVINGGENESSTVEQVADFIYHVGFSVDTSHAKSGWMAF